MLPLGLFLSVLSSSEDLGPSLETPLLILKVIFFVIYSNYIIYFKNVDLPTQNYLLKIFFIDKNKVFIQNILKNLIFHDISKIFSPGYNPSVVSQILTGQLSFVPFRSRLFGRGLCFPIRRRRVGNRWFFWKIILLFEIFKNLYLAKNTSFHIT